MDDEPQRQPPPPDTSPPSADSSPPPPPPPPPPAYAPSSPPGYAPPPSPYGAPPGPPGSLPPGYGYAPPRTEGNAIAALVVSILALFVCGIVTGIIALVLANQAKRKIEASGGQLTGLGMVTAARIIAIIAIVLNVIGLVLIISAS